MGEVFLKLATTICVLYIAQKAERSGVAVVRGGGDDRGFNGVLVGWLGFACTKMGTPIKMI